MENNQSPTGLGNIIVSALIQFFRLLIFVLFVCPFNFWRKAAERLDKSRGSWSWTEHKTNSRWPFLSFVKAIIFGFVFDGLIFISYFVGVGVAFYKFFYVWLSYGGDFTVAYPVFVMTLVYAYYAPMFVSPVRDLLYILIMPFSKFLSWCSRPAQYLEIDMNKKEKGA